MSYPLPTRSSRTGASSLRTPSLGRSAGTSATPRAGSSTIKSISTIILFFLVGYLYIHVLILNPTALQMLQHMNNPSASLSSSMSTESLSSSSLTTDKQRQQYEDEVRTRIVRLENMLFSYLSFGIDPFLYGKIHKAAQCNNMTKLEDYCKQYKQHCHLSMVVCLDDLPTTTSAAAAAAASTTRNDKNSIVSNNNNNSSTTTSSSSPCVVYDFGIREEPEFGVVLSREPFGCEIHAFDPSPITTKWFQQSREGRELQQNPGYTLHNFGGGGADENITLREYNWGQVSMYRYPERVLNIHNCNSNDQCRYHFYQAQTEHQLPVRSVSSIMKELGHAKIDILKLDVEGSEYRMLEELILSGTCRKVDQLTLEWHHYDVDLRYGEGSVPMINVLITLLAKECGLYQYWIHGSTGWPSNEKLYGEMGLVLRYNLAAFRRVKDKKTM